MTKIVLIAGLAAAGALGLSTLGRAQQQGQFTQSEFPWNSINVDGKLTTIHVQGSVSVIQGAGGNVAVQTGERGVVVVDSGLEQNAKELLAAIRKLSDRRIQYIINTHMHPDHTGGNDALRAAGVTITGANVAGNLSDATQGAQIMAHENVLNRMSAPTGKQAVAAFGAWPTITYVSGQNELFFNEEPIEVRWQPAAHTDGDSIVIFRRSDVVATGDIFVTTNYPFIDLERGGGIQGEIDALNNLLDIAIPKHEEEGGTYLIPGHGRICDEYDLLEFRDMVTIIRDRIRNEIKNGKSLEQVKAAGLTKDYDPRWSAKQGLGTAENFVSSIYKSLSEADKKK